MLLFFIFFGCTCLSMDRGNLPTKLLPKTLRAQQLYNKARALIESKSNLNVNIEGQGPLLAKATLSNEHIATTLLLLSHGANPDVIDALGKTPLLYAAENCADRNVGALVHFGANPNHTCYQQRSNKMTPLHALCTPNQDSFDQNKINARQNAIEWLLAAHANTNLKDIDECTPIFNLITCFKGSKISILLPSLNKKNFQDARKTLINTFLVCKASLETKDLQGNDLHHQNRYPIDPYLSMYTALKGKQRHKKLCELLLQFLKGSPNKPDFISPFKKLHSDIIKYILKQVYP